MVSMEKVAVSLREASERSGIKRSALYTLFNSGALLPRKRGKSLLLIVEELDRYVLGLPTRPPRPTASKSGPSQPPCTALPQT
jgi:hypothetical protein